MNKRKERKGRVRLEMLTVPPTYCHTHMHTHLHVGTYTATGSTRVLGVLFVLGVLGVFVPCASVFCVKAATGIDGGWTNGRWIMEVVEVVDIVWGGWMVGWNCFCCFTHPTLITLIAIAAWMRELFTPPNYSTGGYLFFLPNRCVRVTSSKTPSLCPPAKL